MAKQSTYLCIDLKSFYASVECVERGLDPLKARLVVADPERGRTTICLAITPALKELGIPNRCRVFNIPEHVDYIMATPRMKRYMEVSAEIYGVYLKYISPEDMHVYSIDECFIDITPYLALYNKTAKDMAIMLMDAVLQETGICATAGIGTNLFLAKVALDITAKHVPDHIGYLDENRFKQTIWNHQPLTDIWNIGPGIAKRLAKYGVRDLQGVCNMDEHTLYQEFGVNAEFLIDHAHGIEPCTIHDIHHYTPQGSSLVNGQILPSDYTFEEAATVLKEMVDLSALELVEKGLVASGISLGVGYVHNKNEGSSKQDLFMGEHGIRAVSGQRKFQTGGSRKIPDRTNSYRKLLKHFQKLFDDTTDRTRLIRRLSIGLSDLVPEDFATCDLFTDTEADEKERHIQETMLDVKNKFGKNALLKGVSLNEKATARERNIQVGGHRA